jgi:hypothetical protein
MEKQYQDVGVVLFLHVLKLEYEPARMKIFNNSFHEVFSFTMFKSGNSSSPNSDQYQLKKLKKYGLPLLESLYNIRQSEKESLSLLKTKESIFKFFALLTIC